MLHSITSSLPNFASVVFKPGMNFIVAEGDLKKNRHGKANSVGKSSVFFLIDYLLGGNAKDDDFDSDQFAGATFTLDATLAGCRVMISRSADKKERAHVVLTGDLSGWSVVTEKQVAAAKEGLFLKIGEWRKILGSLLFNLPEKVPGSVAKKASPPSARELFVFLNRKYFRNVVKSFANQGEEKGTLACTYLMGINWEYIATLIGLKAEDKIVKSIEDTATFEMDNMNQTKASIIKKMGELEKKVSKAEKELANFKAKDSINLFLNQTDDVTGQLREAQQRALNASRRISLAKQSLAGMNEKPDELEKFYKEAKAELGDVVKMKLEEVCDFHNRVHQYRVSILKKEIATYEEELKNANAAIESLDAERAICIQSDLIRDTFVDFNEKQSQLAALRKQLNDIQQAQKLREDAARERARLLKVKSDYAISEKAKFEQFEQEIADLATAFGSAMFNIYGDGIKPKLEVSFYDGERPLGKKKPYTIKVSVSIQGDKGSGIAHVKVCVFDYLLFAMCHKQGYKIDFLLHDSPAFESSDGNQFPGVMAHAAEMVKTTNAQYICAIDRERFNIACAKSKEFDALAAQANEVTLSEKHKLYGFDY